MEKILLTILPYWSPIIPPAAPAALKSFLQPRGYSVRTVDLIARKESLEFYYEYFNRLKKYIPPGKQGNFFNVGHDLLQQHMTAHLHQNGRERYIHLVGLLIHTYYYETVEENCILELNGLIDNYYKKLRRYFLYLLELEKPDVLGVTVYKTTLAASLFILKLTREHYPHIKTVMGGGIFADSHAVGSPNFEILAAISKDYLDKIFIGPGEQLFLAYLQGRLPGTQRVYTTADLESPPLGFEDIDLPDFSDFNPYKYTYMPAAASVSCMYRCTFCNEIKYWGKFRKKEPGQVVDEMTALYKKHGRQLFFMTDSLLNPVVDDLSREIIKRDAPFYYDAFFRIDQASTDIGRTLSWRRGGLYRVRIGIESGSREILDKINKNITVEQVKNALSSLAFAGIKTTTYWIIGHPGETEKDFQNTLDLIEEQKDNIWQAECNPFRYYYNNQNHSDEWAGYRVPLFPGELEDMLIFKEWTLNLDPPRETIIQRINRFVSHCRTLGIPNPYSTLESDQADKRWKSLHQNAVPPLLDFVGEKSFVNESRNIQPLSLVADTRKSDPDFTF